MSNPSIDPLMALLGQAERERDTAVALLQQANDSFAAAQSQADQLVAYRGEYEARFREQFKSNNSVSILQCYQGFSSRLTQAIEQQQHIAAHAERKVEQAREDLREQEMRVASVRKLLERRLTEQRIAADRRDQKQTDEFAARAAWAQLQQRSIAA
ncbi:flagellar export protein FliJ [Piscinibacter gummiphilus]|uniref:Flagellar FliJ protein n=1 Tax=Piscinibacter gummiphilus TaxID=946333 RepID=A0ABZ0CXX7_9BURK|nr:flagellar export protein FliJ [Piscinibacter gummiphilus]WOB09820.1 flagellar export protein FliJ [Piscinibacter gummiphilus]